MADQGIEPVSRKTDFFQFCLGDPCGITLIKPASCTVSQFEGDLYGSSLYDGFDGLRDGSLYPVSSFDL